MPNTGSSESTVPFPIADYISKVFTSCSLRNIPFGSIFFLADRNSFSFGYIDCMSCRVALNSLPQCMRGL